MRLSCRLMLLAGAFALGVIHLAAADADTVLKPIQLPSPRIHGGKPLMDALLERKTTREMKPDKLAPQQLSDLLWAAFGINRPSDGRRTAPSAMNSQEIELYVAFPEGLFVYEPKPHQLRPVVARDFREKTGQTFTKDASLVLIYVADLSRFGKAKDDVRTFYAAFDGGCVSQNVYLYCASEGLATVVYDLNRPALAATLGLKPGQYVIMAQAVGFPK